jgi:hypothetical protein
MHTSPRATGRCGRARAVAAGECRVDRKNPPRGAKLWSAAACCRFASASLLAPISQPTPMWDRQAGLTKAAASCRTPKRLRRHGLGGVIAQTPRERAVNDVCFQPSVAAATEGGSLVVLLPPGAGRAFARRPVARRRLWAAGRRVVDARGGQPASARRRVRGLF